ncbi:hypothetical protein [Alteromonas sp. H39]|uniref:hypothetical protein n=1 Tax=Alteromonas sp. H39 TaxID=3389876 RepID=UPI0039DFDEA2
MDTAIYTLIGALGSVVITQIANYFLESKRSNNQIKLKSLDILGNQQLELKKERRVHYAKFLEAADKAMLASPHDPSLCVGEMYSALIISSEETSVEISRVFSHLKKDSIEHQSYLNAKAPLLKAMRADLQN